MKRLFLRLLLVSALFLPVILLIGYLDFAMPQAWTDRLDALSALVFFGWMAGIGRELFKYFHQDK
jgi:hypothetical protein